MHKTYKAHGLARDLKLKRLKYALYRIGSNCGKAYYNTAV